MLVLGVELVELAHPAHVELGLRVVRDPSDLVDRPGAGIVSGEDQVEVAPIAPREIAQMADAAADVVDRVIGVLDAMKPCRRRHQLHEPHRALRRGRARLEVRFGANHRFDEIGVERGVERSLADRRIEALRIGALERLQTEAGATGELLHTLQDLVAALGAAIADEGLPRRRPHHQDVGRDLRGENDERHDDPRNSPTFGHRPPGLGG